MADGRSWPPVGYRRRTAVVQWPGSNPGCDMRQGRSDGPFSVLPSRHVWTCVRVHVWPYIVHSRLYGRHCARYRRETWGSTSTDTIKAY